MKAIRIYGSSGHATISLDEVAIPEPAAGEVLVRVHATAVTPGELEWYPTWHTPKGEPRAYAVPCHEFSGVIEDIAPDGPTPAPGAPTPGAPAPDVPSPDVSDPADGAPVDAPIIDAPLVVEARAGDLRSAAQAVLRADPRALCGSVDEVGRVPARPGQQRDRHGRHDGARR